MAEERDDAVWWKLTLGMIPATALGLTVLGGIILVKLFIWDTGIGTWRIGFLIGYISGAAGIAFINELFYHIHPSHSYESKMVKK